MRDTFNRVNISRAQIPKESRDNVSSFLVPESFLSELKSREHNLNIHLFLRYLIRKFRKFTALREIPGGNKLRTKYQNEGLNLVQLNFRPWDSDWAELGIWANGLGVSRCWLFSYLLELEFSLLGEFLDLPEVIEGLTTLTNSIPRNISQFSKDKQYFIRKLHFKT